MNGNQASSGTYTVFVFDELWEGASLRLLRL